MEEPTFIKVPPIEMEQKIYTKDAKAFKAIYGKSLCSVFYREVGNKVEIKIAGYDPGAKAIIESLPD